MEIEQDISRFKKTAVARLLPTSGNDAIINKQLKKVISSGYNILDKLAGHRSYFLLDPSFEHSLPPEFHRVFQLLDKEGFVQKYSFSETRYNDAPFFYRADLHAKYKQGSTDGNTKMNVVGHGFGKDREVIFPRAFGEFLERFFLTLYHKKNLRQSSMADFKKRGEAFIDLNLLAGFSGDQKNIYPAMRFNKESIFYWEKVKRITTNETVYAPAQAVYWNYIKDEHEPRLCEGNTNGAGGFSTLEGAILAGMYELIQRDSFLLYWLNCLSPQRIDPHTVPHPAFKELLAESERYGFRVYCLNLANDTGIPAFAVMIADVFSKELRFCLGAGCQSNPIEALYRAFEEAWGVYFWIRPRPSFPALDETYRPFNASMGQDERLRLWFNPDMAPHMDFFLSGKEESFSETRFDYPEKFTSQKEELNFLVNKIEKMGPGYEVYFFQANHPFLSRLGYYVAQTIVPQFAPLYLNESFAPLGSRRLKEVPKKMGFSSAENFNPLPHPFP